MEYKIEQMAPADKDEILSIYREGLESGDILLDAEYPETWVDFSGKSGIVVRESDKVIGWAAVTLIAGEDVPDGVGKLSVFVRPDYRNQGIGRILVNTTIALSEQAGVRVLVSGIVPKNVPALMLHKTCGFKAMGMLRQAGTINGELADAVLLQYTCA